MTSVLADPVACVTPCSHHSAPCLLSSLAQGCLTFCLWLLLLLLHCAPIVLINVLSQGTFTDWGLSVLYNYFFKDLAVHDLQL